jgi:hypothetical protein
MAFDYQSVEYRYFLTDLLTNNIIAEVPFSGVSFQRANRRAGSFSGSIPFIEETKSMNLYEATMPGRTGLYITRNGVCVWGGIIWRRSYSSDSKELQVEGAEFMSYFYHRNVWQTLIYGTDFVIIVGYQATNGIATITTQDPHGYAQGEVVEILGVGPALNGFREVESVLSATQYTVEVTSGNVPATSVTSGVCRVAIDTYEFARDLMARAANDLAGVSFINDAYKPSRQREASVILKERVDSRVTIKTADPHGLIVGQEITLIQVDDLLDGVHEVIDIPDETTVVFELNGPDVPRTSLSGIRTLNVTIKQAFAGLGTITTDVPHGATTGQTIVVSNVDSFFTGRLDNVFNGEFEVIFINSPNQLGFLVDSILDIPNTPVSGGTVTLGSRFVYGDFGSFSANSDIDIILGVVEDGEKSGFYQDTQYIFGYENRTVGEVLEKFSTNIGGFEYRIDCDYNFETASFERFFRLLKTDDKITTSNGFELISSLLTEEELAALDEPYPRSIEYFKANQTVFEFPGNIDNFSVEESAEEAATRFFVVGNDEEIGTDSFQPYAVASSAEFLTGSGNDDAWPLLDQVETLSEISDQEELYNYAVDYLFESLPPISEFKISVNGSLNPQVGSYAPGDWCAIILNDEYARQAAASSREPRKDILLRKINSYKVSVPDSPHLPEKVELELITDWKADRSGN